MSQNDMLLIGLGVLAFFLFRSSSASASGIYSGTIPGATGTYMLPSGQVVNPANPYARVQLTPTDAAALGVAQNAVGTVADLQALGVFG